MSPASDNNAADLLCSKTHNDVATPIQVILPNVDRAKCGVRHLWKGLPVRVKRCKGSYVYEPWSDESRACMYPGCHRNRNGERSESSGFILFMFINRAAE